MKKCISYSIYTLFHISVEMFYSFLRRYKIPSHHYLHQRFRYFRKDMKNIFILKYVEQISSCEFSAIETNFWSKYLLAPLEEKEEQFQHWLNTEEVLVKASSTPSLKKGKSKKKTHRRCYNFMIACIQRLYNSKAWYDNVMQKRGGVENLKKRYTIDVNRIFEQFNIAADKCPNSREKKHLCDQLERLLPHA